MESKKIKPTSINNSASIITNGMIFILYVMCFVTLYNPNLVLIGYGLFFALHMIMSLGMIKNVMSMISPSDDNLYMDISNINLDLGGINFLKTYFAQFVIAFILLILIGIPAIGTNYSKNKFVQIHKIGVGTGTFFALFFVLLLLLYFEISIINIISLLIIFFILIGLPIIITINLTNQKMYSYTVTSQVGFFFLFFLLFFLLFFFLVFLPIMTNYNYIMNNIEKLFNSSFITNLNNFNNLKFNSGIYILDISIFVLFLILAFIVSSLLIIMKIALLPFTGLQLIKPLLPFVGVTWEGKIPVSSTIYIGLFFLFIAFILLITTFSQLHAKHTATNSPTMPAFLEGGNGEVKSGYKYKTGSDATYGPGYYLNTKTGVDFYFNDTNSQKDSDTFTGIAITTTVLLWIQYLSYMNYNTLNKFISRLIPPGLSKQFMNGQFIIVGIIILILSSISISLTNNIYKRVKASTDRADTTKRSGSYDASGNFIPPSSSTAPLTIYGQIQQMLSSTIGAIL